ncbi:hypothetical protein CKO_03477 [Citrobacter koseri ATCC BAA-895]|uniref:Uncharacterized protein n=1 Tax=Citrobacter koseri (strain ATCC BAA-895 / CDC 4225-83 / SGSC4696) TaxID=290338 RepID=A8AM44_CITK8|nr:hypothetical protein CKO_03477 [Citrobacter koseri ATCC BAA-895]
MDLSANSAATVSAIHPTQQPPRRLAGKRGGCLDPPAHPPHPRCLNAGGKLCALHTCSTADFTVPALPENRK